MLKSIRFIMIFVSMLISSTLWAEPGLKNYAQYVTQSISISGMVEHPDTLTVSDLKNFPSQKIETLQMICQTGANVGKLENVRGVRLKDVLEKAIIKAPEHNDVKKTIIIATASDGYTVVYSWSEVFNTSVGDGVMILFEKDGTSLPDEEGRIAMVSTKDLRTGPRHVKWLQHIEVRKIE